MKKLIVKICQKLKITPVVFFWNLFTILSFALLAITSWEVFQIVYVILNIFSLAWLIGKIFDYEGISYNKNWWIIPTIPFLSVMALALTFFGLYKLAFTLEPWYKRISNKINNYFK